VGKGGKCTRFVGEDSANNLILAEVWINDAANMAANETITLTVKTG
jgi:hypothetical protein